MSLTVIGAPLSPFVRKVRVVLAEKQLEYKLDPVSPFAPPADFEKISPLKRIPVLRDDSEGPEALIPDSSVICAYLEKKFPTPALYPSSPFAYARALWFEEYADSDFVATTGLGMFRPVVLNALMKKAPDIDVARDTWETKVPRFLQYYEEQLNGRSHFIGDSFTIADIAVASPFVNVAHAGFAPDEARYPNLVRFLKATLARPSFAACVAHELKALAPTGLKYAL
jgi:glutathione S-transferase